MSKLNLFLPLTKIDVENRLVYGVVAAEVVDNSGETFDYSKSKPYFEKWSANAELTSGGLSKGNLREMHGKIAAGKLTDLAFDDDTKTIECCAKVVDDQAWAKCLEGVYTGFSMGGRYAEKWVEKMAGGEQKRYAGDPAEISLVDKPCIPTATFQLIKADGMVEEHHFTSVISEDTGDNLMKRDYTPTNDELAVRGKELAKADGKPETSWLDYSDAARDALISEHLAKADKAEDKEGTAKEGEDKGDFDPNAEKGPKPDGSDDGTSATADGEGDAADDRGDATGAADEDKDAKDKKDKKDGGKPFGKSDTPDKEPVADATTSAEAEETAEKSDSGVGDEVEQGWRSTDGKFHLKKADAVAHNEALKKAANTPETLLDLVGELAKTVAAAKGEEEAGESETAVEKSDVVRHAEFLEGMAALVKADDADGQELNKSMYTVERMARVLRDVASLQISVSKEQKREGDNSETPGMIGVALGQLGDTLLAMAKEEVDELMLTVANDGVAAGDQASVSCYDDCYYELAASTLGLEKAAFDELGKAAGAKKSAYVQSMHDKMSKMGAKCADLKKADADDLTKVDGENSELLKRAMVAEEQIAQAMPLIKTLMADMAKIKDMPQPAAPRTSILEKGDDGKGPSEMRAQTAEELLKSHTPEQLADAAIRMSQQHGFHMTSRGVNHR